MSDSIAKIDPQRAALLIMDYQNGIVGMVDNGEELVAIAGNLINVFREHGGHVAYVRVAFTEEDYAKLPASSGMGANLPEERRAFLHADAEPTQIHQAIAPQDGDIVVRKTRVGAFGTTDLDEQLKSRGIDTLVIGGISTSGCVLSTVPDAFDRDYRVIVLEDACADPNKELHETLLRDVFPKRASVISVRELHGLLH